MSEICRKPSRQLQHAKQRQRVQKSSFFEAKKVPKSTPEVSLGPPAASCGPNWRLEGPKIAPGGLRKRKIKLSARPRDAQEAPRAPGSDFYRNSMPGERGIGVLLGGPGHAKKKEAAGGPKESKQLCSRHSAVQNLAVLKPKRALLDQGSAVSRLLLKDFQRILARLVPPQAVVGGMRRRRDTADHR